MSPRILLVALLLAAAPQAMAGGSLDAEVGVVQVEDGFGRSCPMPLAGFCLFVVHDDGNAGNLSLDAYQRIDYVGVATDFSLFREHLGEAWLLPDKELVQNFSDLYLEHPVFVTATEAYQSAAPEDVREHVLIDETGWRWSYPFPDMQGGTSEWRFDAFDYSDSGGIRYDAVGPTNTAGGNTTDNYYDFGHRFSCEWSGACPEPLPETFAAVPAAAPNVAFGFEFYDVHLATDPDNLTRQGASVLQPAENLTFRAGAPAEPVPEAVEPSRRPAQDGAVEEDPAPAPRARHPPTPEARQPPVKVLGQAPTSPPADLPVPLILGATAAGLFLVALGAGLYSRFHSRSEVLQSETRDRLVELVRLNPGISLTDAATAMGMARNAVQHHVRMLARVNVVRVASEGNRKALYLVGGKPSDAPPAWLLKNAACAAVVRALQANPQGLPREAVHGLMPDVPERTRNYNIRKLLSVGVVVQVETPEGGKLLRFASAPAS